MKYNIKLLVILIFIVAVVINNLLINFLSSCFTGSIASNDEVVKLSLLLNKERQKISKNTCDLLNLSNSSSSVRTWCSKISLYNESEYYADVYLARGISNLLYGKRVVSFGEGPGVYKQFILNLNEVNGYDAYDGAPFIEEATNYYVRYLDLSLPVFHIKKYDWVLSLEVAEHIPRESESVFVDNLVRHAKEGIILSWASVGQDGLAHINTRNFKYINRQLEKRGFHHDWDKSEYLQNAASFIWLKKNVNVYLRF